MKNLSRLTTLCALLSFFTLSAQATNPLDVVTNEIAWMGTDISANDEWIELYNKTENPINLDGWQLASQDGTPKINLSGTIPGHGFYLLERTDDKTVPEIIADLIYKGALTNSGENLKLSDSANNVIDEIDCSAGWFAGLGKPEYKTMERINSLVSGSDSSNWQTSQNSGGTPKAENSKQITESEEQKAEKMAENSSLPTEKEAMDESKPPTIEFEKYPAGIVLNEILPSPEGPDETDEWIEIFNQNNFEVNISNWKITDIAGKTETYAFPQITKIPAQGFLVLSRPTSKITLNNDGDRISLSQPDGKVINEVHYEKAPQGQSYNRINSNWAWSTNLSPGAANFIPFPQPEEKTETEPLKDKSATGHETKRESAAIGEQISKSSKSLFVLLIALAVAIFSGIIILIIKRRLKNASDID